MRCERKFISLASLLLLAACSGGSKVATTGVILPNGLSTNFKCTANPAITQVASGAAFDVTVSVTNGTAPFKLGNSSDTSTFSTTKKIQASLVNDTSVAKTMAGSVRVIDSVGAIADCAYAVAVAAPTTSTPVCAQSIKLMVNENAKTCTQALTACQASDLLNQGFKEVTTRKQCNTYCSNLTTSCSSYPDPDALVCSIVPAKSGTYFATLPYEFEVRGVQNGVPVDITVDSFNTSPSATIEDLGQSPYTLGRRKKLTFPASAIPSGVDNILGSIMAKAHLTSDPNTKCNYSQDGTVPQYPIPVTKIPSLVCKMELENILFYTQRTAGSPVYLTVTATRANVPAKLDESAIAFTVNKNYERMDLIAINSTTYALTYSFTWNASVIPSGSTFTEISLSAKAKLDPNWPAQAYCNDDTAGQGTIAGVKFNLYNN